MVVQLKNLKPVCSRAHFFIFKPKDNSELQGELLSYESIADSISIDDLIASVFWQTESSEDLTRKIISEQEKGLRDKASIKLGFLIIFRKIH